MRLTRRRLVLLITLGLIVALAPMAEGADEALCYAAADGGDQLVSSWRTGGGFVNIGDFGSGVDDVEAITFNLDNSILYGTDNDILGSINITNGVFTAIGAAVGAGALAHRFREKPDRRRRTPGF